MNDQTKKQSLENFFNSASARQMLSFLVDSGCYFGHRKNRRHPKMAPYIFQVRNNIDIINLQHTVVCLKNAFDVIAKVISKKGRILFVGTKDQAKEIVREEAQRCGQYYVNERWLGGTLTNRRTVGASIGKMKRLEALLEDPAQLALYSKKECHKMTLKKDKIEKNLGGIRDMHGLPDLLFVVDVCKERIAVLEALRLKIPVIGLVDTNGNPQDITYPIPGNDDSHQSISAFCRLISDAVMLGLQKEAGFSGKDQSKVEEALLKQEIQEEGKESFVEGK